MCPVNWVQRVHHTTIDSRTALFLHSECKQFVSAHPEVPGRLPSPLPSATTRLCSTSLSLCATDPQWDPLRWSFQLSSSDRRVSALFFCSESLARLCPRILIPPGLKSYIHTNRAWVWSLAHKLRGGSCLSNSKAPDSGFLHGSRRNLCFFFKEKLKYNYFPMVTQTVKTLPAMQETQVQAPGQEDPLEEEMATRSSVLAERIPWTEEPGGATVHGVMRLTLS